MEHCQLCYASLTGLFAGRMQTVCDGAQLQDILTKCSKYLSKDMIYPSPNWNLPFCVAPFCEECGENTQQLVQLDMKLEQLNSEMKQLVARISGKILNERQNYQMLNAQLSKSIIPQPQPPLVPLPVHHLTEARPEVPAKPIGDTFEGWDLPSSSDSVYDSLHDDTLSGQGDIANTTVPENVDASKKRKKGNKSPRRQENSNSSTGVEKINTKVTSADLQTKSNTGGFACPKCNKKFTRVDILKRHNCGSQTFECETCGKSFSSQGSLQIHNRTHTGEKPHKCETCGKCFTLPHHLRLHLQTHSEEKPYQCDICKKSFKEKNYLLTHKRQHSTDENERRKYKCEICSKSFTLYKTLRNHLVLHTGESKYKCKVCGKASQTAQSLRVHELTHSGEKKFKCSHCWKTFTRAEGLKNHEAVHTGRKDFQCDECGKSFYNFTALDHHRRRKHINAGDFVCDICGRMYKTQMELKEHKRLHEKASVEKVGPTPKNFICVVCNRSYTRENHLTKHQKEAHVVTTISTVVCEKCEKDFETVIEFNNHKRVHPTNTERYKCEICNEIFRTRCDKICHFSRNHTESDFPFKCVCERAFIGRKDLYRHKRNECTVKRITTKLRNNVRRRKKTKLEIVSEPSESDSEVEEKVHVSKTSRRNLRRSRRFKRRRIIEESEDSENSSDGEADRKDENSASDGEQLIEIKAEQDIWVKEEPVTFSD